jgi:hypothetical protein
VKASPDGEEPSGKKVYVENQFLVGGVAVKSQPDEDRNFWHQRDCEEAESRARKGSCRTVQAAIKINNETIGWNSEMTSLLLQRRWISSDKSSSLFHFSFLLQALPLSVLV